MFAKKILSKIALAAAALLFAACDFGFDGDSFQNKAGAYFKEMTSTAAVVNYTMDMTDVLTDKDGNFCFGFDQDRKITFTLRNPQRYVFIPDNNLRFTLQGNDAASPLPNVDMVTIEQDPNDTSTLYMTFPADFLKANPLGVNITPTIMMEHPVSHAPFPQYDSLKLSSNPPPPLPSGAIAMQNSDSPSKWVICFNLPTESVLNQFYRDLAIVDVNGDAAATTVSSSGAVSFAAGSKITTTAPSGLVANQNTGLSFKPDGQAVYYGTNDEADEKEKIYTVKMTDQAGLESTFAISTRGLKLSEPNAYTVEDTTFSHPFDTDTSTRNFVNQEDDGSSFVILHAEAKTAVVHYTDKQGNPQTIPSYDYDPANAQIVYEVYKEPTLVTLVNAGTIKGLTGKISVPAGTSYIKAYVRKPLYSDSDIPNWWCRAVATKFFVSEEGDDVKNAGSKSSPYRTIQKGVAQFVDGMLAGDYPASTPCQIKILTDLSVPSDFAYTSNNNALIDIPSSLSSATVTVAGEGGTKAVNLQKADSLRLILNAACGTTVLKELSFTGAAGDATNALIKVDNGATAKLESAKISQNALSLTSGCIVDVAAAGTFEMTGGEISDNTNYIVIVNNGTAAFTNATIARNSTGNTTVAASRAAITNGLDLTMTGCTVTENQGVKGGAIYNGHQLTLDSCTITGNTTQTDGGAVYFDFLDSGAKLTIQGSNTICDNHTAAEPSKQNNIFLNDSGSGGALPLLKLTVGGDLSGSMIGLHYPDTVKPTITQSVEFTSNYAHGSLNPLMPGACFMSDYGYGISAIETSKEAAFVVSSGNIFTPQDYDIKLAGDTVYTYPNAAKTVAVNVTASRSKAGITQPLTYKSDGKLYITSSGVPASDKAVTWKVDLYDGGSPSITDLAYSAGDGCIYVSVPAMSYVNTYTIKATATYMNYPHNSSAPLDCSYGAENAAAYINSLTAAGTYPVTVTGPVGPGANDGLAKVANAIKAKTDPVDTNIRIELDASGTSAVGSLVAYNDGKYFMNCAALVSIKLPSWMEFIIHDLFNGCTNLSSVTVPDTVEYIGRNAFNGCSNLASITLPVSICDQTAPCGIDAGAFVGCKSGFEINFAGTKDQWSSVVRPDQTTTVWHDGAKETGDDAGSVTCADGKCGFDYKNPLLVPLTLEATENDTTITYHNMAEGSVYYRINGGTDIEISTGETQTITLDAGHKVEFYGNNPRNSNGDPTRSEPTVKCDKPCYVYGNFMSLVNKQNFATEVTLTADNAFLDFFNSWDNKIENKPGQVICLPATTLTKNCYRRMFQYCNDLQTAPDLPATTLAESCYGEMFSNCSLTSAPALPATTLAKSCYYCMFYSCEFTDAPTLPATTLAENCYEEMFRNCSSLSNAPALPATTLAKSCYESMFDGCVLLERAPDLPAPTLANGCYRHMFKGCSSLNYIKCLATNMSATLCTREWVIGVPSGSDRIFVKAAAANWSVLTEPYYGIPSDWTVQSQ